MTSHGVVASASPHAEVEDQSRDMKAVEEMKETVMRAAPDERTRKRPRAATRDDAHEADARTPPASPAPGADSDEATAGQVSTGPPQTYAKALEALNASFMASIQAQLRVDPASDLSSLTREYEASVRELRARYAPAAVMASALEALEEELGDGAYDPETTPQTVSFVASSDVADTGERELEEDEVYFGASLDLNAFSSSSREVEFMPRESTSDMALDAGGFLASEATYSASSIWNDPELQRVRVPSDQIQPHSVLCSNAYTENWRGTCGQTPVVIKRLASAAQTMANALAFAQHIRMITPLQHPSLVTILGVAWEKALDIRVATEFMARGDLRSLLATADVAGLSWALGKCQVAIDIADAFAYVHSQCQHAIPSQVTSRKVLIDVNGSAKLNLLQLAGICGAEDALIPWTAPEVLKGEPRAPQSDLYTLGVLLCELDTTKPVYAEAVNPDGSKMALQVIAQHVARGELSPVLTDTCPPEIAVIARQCLLVDPSQRPEALRVAYALREILKNEL